MSVGQICLVCSFTRYDYLQLQESPQLQMEVQGYFCPKHKDAKIFINHLNPVKLVFIGMLSLSALK